MNSPTDCRRHIKWPVLYANRDLIGQGTVCELSDIGCQVTGTMPVAAGMILKIWISPEHRAEALFVKQAKVVWADAQRFGLELHDMDYQDHQWLVRYLSQQP